MPPPGMAGPPLPSSASRRPCLGGDQEASDGSRVLDRVQHRLGRVDDAELEHVAIGFALGVIAIGVVALVGDLADDDGTLDAGVLGDLADRRFQRLAAMSTPVRWSSLAPLRPSSAFAARRRATPPPGRMPSSTAARVALRASSTRSFFSLTSTSRSAADADHRHAASELREALLQLLAIIVRGGLLDLRLDLRHAGLDVLLRAGAVDDGRGLLLVADLLRPPSMLSVTFSSLMPRSSEIAVPPVRIAMSSSMPCGGRRSPEPSRRRSSGRHAACWTTRVASASPSTSSATISSGLPVCTTASSTGSMACRPVSIFS